MLKQKYNFHILEAVKMNYRRGDMVNGVQSGFANQTVVGVYSDHHRRRIYGNRRKTLVLWYNGFWALNFSRRVDIDRSSLIKPRKRSNSLS